jgi:hypothetical protein
MISKEQLRELIDYLKERTGKSQQELSKEAGYEEKTLTQLLSGRAKVDKAYNQLRRVYSPWLKNSTYNNDNDIELSLKAISTALQRLENGQAYIRAEIRGYGQYQIMEKAQWDQQKFLKAMEKVGTLIGANLQADDLQGSSENEDN